MLKLHRFFLEYGHFSIGTADMQPQPGLVDLQDEGTQAIRQRSAKQKFRSAKKSWHAQNLLLPQSSLIIDEADGDAVKKIQLFLPPKPDFSRSSLSSLNPSPHFTPLVRLSHAHTHIMADIQERLKKLGQPGRTGGKGTPRRPAKRAPARSNADDKKLQAQLKKLNTQPIQAIEEVNMFKSDGNVIHFAAPKVHAAVQSNTFAIYGNGEDKELTELVPGILNQLGPDSLASLRKLAESYQNMQKAGEKGEDDDDIPDLVEGENFESKVE